MIINQSNTENLRELFINSVIKIFGNSDSFLEFIEDEKYTDRYDCFLSGCGENYIIDRDTGEYINWYKFTHIGRCINISALSMYYDIPGWIDKFLIGFKNN